MNKAARTLIQHTIRRGKTTSTTNFSPTTTTYSPSSLAAANFKDPSELTNLHEYAIENSAYEPLHSRMSYAVSNTHGLHLLYDTVGDRLKFMSEAKPNIESHSFLFSRKKFTFRELNQCVEAFAQGLLNMGFQKGDRLAVMLPSTPEALISIYAAASIGAIVVLMNPAYQLVEIEYMLKKTKAKGLIMLDSIKTLQHYEILKRICPEIENSLKGEINSSSLPHLKHVIMAELIPNAPRDEQKYKGTWSFSEVQNFGAISRDKPLVVPEDPFVMLFTSGTTGTPKAALLTQFAAQNTSYFGGVFDGSAESKRVTCCPIPMFHVFGMVVGVLSPVVTGVNRIVVPNIFPDTLSTMKAIHTERCTSLSGAPVILFDILNSPERKKLDLSSWELVLMGAAVVPKKLILKLKHELKLRHIIIAYGMTESTSAGTITKYTDAELNEKHAYESVGRPFPFTEAKVVDQVTGKVVPHGADGELCLRGYSIMKEYYDEPEKTRETIDEQGWLHTGDVVSMDKEGYVYFKSRAKEIIIRGGVNIYPSEVEAFLMTHEAVQSVQVFGYPDERMGEEVCAWIKLKPDSTPGQLDGDKLKAFCTGKIAYFKIPKYVKIVDGFPINATGKVQKFRMREQMLDDLKKTPANLFKVSS